MTKSVIQPRIPFLRYRSVGSGNERSNPNVSV
jgi:hypothetical protein